jgi:hypothetical protein
MKWKRRQNHEECVYFYYFYREKDYSDKSIDVVSDDGKWYFCLCLICGIYCSNHRCSEFGSALESFWRKEDKESDVRRSCLRGGLIAPEQQTHRAVFDRGIMHSHIRGCKLWSIDSQYTKEAYLRHVAWDVSSPSSYQMLVTVCTSC